jgi:flagellar basal-body rod protein FlgB
LTEETDRRRKSREEERGEVMDLFDQTVFLLSRVLDLRSARHEILAANIANADTPGYMGVDLVFEEELRKALLSAQEVRLAKTHSGHLPEALPLGSVIGRIEPTGTILVGNDLNSVDIEQEMVRLAENSLLYEAAVQALSKRLRGLKGAISEGR